MNLKLVDPDHKYLDEYKEAYNLMIDKVKDGLVKKWNIGFDNPYDSDIIEYYLNMRDESKLPHDYVICYTYFMTNDADNLVGLIKIRLELTDKLLKCGGNIGYAINPKYWNKGYGTKMLKLGLDKARNLGIKDKVLLTCDDDNIGSYTVMENNGAVLENKIYNEKDGEDVLTRRYWINL